MRLYVIGDIHGHLDKLLAAHERVFRDGGRDALIVHVGDLIDRGPDSRSVVAHLSAGRDAGRNWVVTRGNHDRFLPRFLQRPDWVDPCLSRPLPWLAHPGLGAAQTLQSYGLDPELPAKRLHSQALRAVPARHADFLASLPLWYLHPLALVVHAGIRPGVDLQHQREDDLVWIRGPFLDSRADHGILVVHGHTARAHPAHHGNRINIDSGAGNGGALSAVVIEPGAAHLLADSGRVPLPAEPDGAGPRPGP